jgi:hypothetical protein
VEQNLLLDLYHDIIDFPLLEELLEIANSVHQSRHLPTIDLWTDSTDFRIQALGRREITTGPLGMVSSRYT